jgi:MoaA/NifB/PqqE/SkfB family radical SAM enzyme
MIKKLKHYSIPHLLHIEMSYVCNSRCIFCYNPYRKSPIDYSKIDKMIKSVYQAHIPHVYLIGGEPSLLKTEKLNQYIDLLSERSSVTIVTNGLIYKKGLSNKLACIGVPIHGDKKTHEMLTNHGGGYGKVIQTIKNYVRDGFDVRCIPVLMSANYNQMYDVIKLAKNLGMESVFVD